MKRGLDIIRRRLGEGSLSLASKLRRLGECKIQMKNEKEGIELFEESIKIYASLINTPRI